MCVHARAHNPERLTHASGGERALPPEGPTGPTGAVHTFTQARQATQARPALGPTTLPAGRQEVKVKGRHAKIDTCGSLLVYMLLVSV